MFEMTYRNGAGGLVRGGMAFDSPDHAKTGVFMTKNGSMISAKDWPRYKIAFDDDVPPQLDLADHRQYASATDCERRAWDAIHLDPEPCRQSLRRMLREGYTEDDIHEALVKMGHPTPNRLIAEAKSGEAEDEESHVDVDKLAAFLSKHLSPSDVVQGVRIATGETAGESEEDAVRAAVRKGLRKSGLDEEAMEEIAGRVLKNRREAAADYLPANALYGGLGGRLSDTRKRFGANAGATDAADERFDAMFADARRLNEPTGDNFGYGSSNKRRELEEELRRRPRLAMDARAEAKDRKRFQKMFGTKRLEPRGM